MYAPDVLHCQIIVHCICSGNWAMVVVVSFDLVVVLSGYTLVCTTVAAPLQSLWFVAV